MYLKKIRLDGFRNYKNIEVEFDRYRNILYGDNAQGKTNLVEAIYIMATAKSHRTNNNSELINFEGDKFLINVFIENDDNQSINIEYEFNKNKQRSIKVNGVSLSKTGELIGILNAVMFCPESINVLKGGPVERRRFIDILISQMHSSYFYDLQQYYRIVKQKNRILKDFNRSSFDLLDVWNENLAIYAARIIYRRKEVIKNIISKIEKKHEELTEGKEKINIEYNSSIKLLDDYSKEDILKCIKIKLKENIDRELYYKSSLVGPHREDISFFINSCEAKVYASQGQQRSIVLSLKLVENDILKEETGKQPIMILDDVFSELDSKRQDNLIKMLSNVQTFITTTGTDLYKNNLVNNKYYKVKNGFIESSR